MRKQLKTISYVLLAAITLFSTSCLDSPEERTFEQEQQELHELIMALHEEGYDVDTTDLGVYYMYHEIGEGPYPSEGDTLTIEYTGFLTDNTIFDQSAEPWTFNYLEIDLIPGFNSGLSVMKKGGTVEMIIPSNLAYGAYGSGYAIGPFQTLVFIVDMVDLKPVQ